MKNKVRILVVDDDKNLRNALKKTFELIGAEVDVAEDGVNALELVKKNEYSMIMSDVNMPRMNGVSSLEAVNQSNLDIPVVMMTGESEYTAEDIDERNGVVLLQKPVSMKQLKEIVENYAKLLPFKDH